MNHYEVLGIKKNATQAEIREAYKKLIKKYHPDLYQGDKTFAEKKSQSINVAYDILSDSEKRKQYDEEITPNTNYYNYSNINNNKYNSGSSNDSINYNYNKNYYNTQSASYTSDYSYDKYTNNNSRTYSTYDDFYQRRYSNYHRSKIPYSNYTNYDNKKSIFESFFKTGKQQIFAIMAVLLIYLGVLLSNLNQYTSNHNDSIINEKNNNYKNSNYSNTQNSTNNYYIDYEDFDINDYYTDEELLEIYKKHYSTMFNSFDEFKELFSEYLYFYLYNNK